MYSLEGPDEAWRLYRRNWVPLSLMAQLLVFCVAASDFSLQIDSVFCQVVLTAASFAVAGRYLISSNWGSRVAVVLLSGAQLQVLLLLGTPLSYIAASANLPLQDATFAYCDHLLGLDWRAYYNFVMQRPGLIPYAYIGYAMIGLLPVVIPLVLGLTRHYAHLQNFTLACILAICATAAISAILPAIGTYQQLGLPAESLNFKASGYLVQIHELPPVRDGSLRSLYVTHLGGIVTFPSFHAAAAILDLWALWRVWWMRPLALIANAGMLLATPLLGGHYFVDVFAGVGIAVLAIATAKVLHGRPEPFVAPTLRVAATAAGSRQSFGW
jgi:membrane-associated phospholipid phosphatase